VFTTHEVTPAKAGVHPEIGQLAAYQDGFRPAPE
jgi:hypothetical protein